MSLNFVYVATAISWNQWCDTEKEWTEKRQGENNNRMSRLMVPGITIGMKSHAPRALLSVWIYPPQCQPVAETEALDWAAKEFSRPVFD